MESKDKTKGVTGPKLEVLRYTLRLRLIAFFHVWPRFDMYYNGISYLNYFKYQMVAIKNMFLLFIL